MPRDRLAATKDPSARDEGRVYHDPDISGGWARELLANLDGRPRLGADDFQVA